ncbi:MAG: 1-acyl-sn-glycerol-3-phosphate acyltransferase [Rickettsiales bacterium]|jgi:1-acyl-sn-glycerol-3-phosphate acyltransferase|nr:1-acyl-sn-glycerol-3-phosphate acyltransferase [Rickettsiales bacterium]
MMVIKKFFGGLRFFVWFIWSILNLPLFIVSSMLPPNSRVGILQFYMKNSYSVFGFRARRVGNVAPNRPLMIVCNHIGWLELFALPAVAKISFFGKGEIKSWPILGWIVGALGVVYVDRRPAFVKDSLAAVTQTMKRATNPVVLFPEGTTSNGSYVKKFKSSLFNFLEPQLEGKGGDVAIQPVVQLYRYPDGRLIPEKDLADNYAYFNNDSVEEGPKAEVQRNGVAIAVNIMALGGILVEYHFLPVVDLSDVHDRKELADKLQKIIAAKYKELRAEG